MKSDPPLMSVRWKQTPNGKASARRHRGRNVRPHITPTAPLPVKARDWTISSTFSDANVLSPERISHLGLVCNSVRLWLE